MLIAAIGLDFFALLIAAIGLDYDAFLMAAIGLDFSVLLMAVIGLDYAALLIGLALHVLSFSSKVLPPQLLENTREMGWFLGSFDRGRRSHKVCLVCPGGTLWH